MPRDAGSQNITKPFHCDSLPSAKGCDLLDRSGEGTDPAARLMTSFRSASGGNLEGVVITARPKTTRRAVNHGPLGGCRVGDRFRQSHFEIIQTICTTCYTRPPSHRTALKELFSLPLTSCHSFPVTHSPITCFRHEGLRIALVVDLGHYGCVGVRSIRRI